MERKKKKKNTTGSKKQTNGIIYKITLGQPTELTKIFKKIRFSFRRFSGADVKCFAIQLSLIYNGVYNFRSSAASRIKQMRIDFSTIKKSINFIKNCMNIFNRCR